MLNLDLGEIVQESNENDNNNTCANSNSNSIINSNSNSIINNNNSNNSNNIGNSKRILSQSLNFMKTTKFSMKKVFKFTNNV